MSGEHRSTADRLFETLETTTRLVSGDARRHSEEDGGSASVPDLVLTDTVGFIKKLPTQLVHSFASTLEAAAEADVLVLCADASSETMEEEIRTVEETLSETLGNDADGDGAAHRETLLCLNKMDLVSSDRRRELEASYPGAIMISARVDASPLLDAVHEALSRDRVRMRVLIPHAEYAAVSDLYGRAEIHARDDTAEGIEMDVTLPKPRVGRYARYRIG